MSKGTDNFLTGVIAVVFIGVLLFAYVGCNQMIYGDWRCAFAECRLLKGE